MKLVPQLSSSPLQYCYTDTCPRQMLWGFHRPAGSLSESFFLQICVTRRKRFSKFSNSEHNCPFCRLAENISKLFSHVMWTDFYFHLFPLIFFKSFVLDTITNALIIQSYLMVILPNPVQTWPNLTGQVIYELHRYKWWLFLGKTPWMIKWYFYFILNSKLIITCGVTHVTFPSLKNEDNKRLKTSLTMPKKETHRYCTQTMDCNLISVF